MKIKSFYFKIVKRDLKGDFRFLTPTGATQKEQNHEVPHIVSFKLQKNIL